MTQPVSAPTSFHRWIKVLLVGALAAIATLTLFPTWVGGQLPWNQPLPVPHLKSLQTLRKAALPLPGWTVTSHEVITLNGPTWIFNQYQAQKGSSTTPAVDQIVVMLRPQPSPPDQPALEWSDLAGAQQWKVDSRRIRPFTVQAGAQPVRVRAQFSRSWNPQHTFATLQWFAWPTGGDVSSNRWFWADQFTQWRTHQRLPWVAVSVLLPIEPLGDIGLYEPLAIALGQEIQTQLIQGPLAADPAS